MTPARPGPRGMPSYTPGLMATGIGDTLRATRERQGRTRTDAAADTRIREHTLRALEEERFSGLGGAVYVKGFLRSYGRFLGLDPEELVHAYERRPHTADPSPPILAVPAGAAAPGGGGGGRRTGARVAVAALTVLALVLAGAGLLADGGHPSPRQAPSGRAGDHVRGARPEATAKAPPRPAYRRPDARRAHGPRPAAAPGVRVALDVGGGSSWVRVLVDGRERLETTLGPGQTRRFRGRRRVDVRLGNAGAVRVLVDGRDRGALGGYGEVVDAVFTAKGGT